MNANDTDSFDFAAFFKSELTIPWSHCRTSSLKAASERAIVVLSEKSYAGNFLTGKHVVACECSWHTELRSNSQRNGAAATTDRSTIARHIENTFPRQKFQTTIPKSFRLSSSKAITIFDFHAQYSEKKSAWLCNLTIFGANWRSRGNSFSAYIDWLSKKQPFDAFESFAKII